MNPTPNASQESLRDARLAMAWKHMPDAHMQPSDATRKAVLQAGKQAVTVRGSLPAWWQHLKAKPHHRSQWTTAVASMLVASFITVMWYGTSAPDASPDEAQVADQYQEYREESTATRAAPAGPAQTPTRKSKTAPVDTPMGKTEATVESPAAIPPPAITAAPSESISGNAAEMARSAPATSAVVAPSPPPAPMGAAARAAAKVNAADASTSDISTTERSRTDAPASSALEVTIDGQPARINAQQASQLLAALHALPYESFDEDAHPSTQRMAITVRSNIGEVWQVAPDRVEARSASTAPALVIHITPDQYQLLRRLAGSEAAP